MTAETYRRLRALIASGSLAPGSPLIETDLSLRLGASRTPIRAALLKLQQEGFVVATRVGKLTRVIVSPLTAENVRELHYMVGALEGLAARKAAELSRAKREALAKTMESLNSRLKEAGRAADVRSAQDLHIKFHRCFVEAAAGPRLLAELDSLQPQVERYERFYTGALITEHAFVEALDEHRAIIDAIREGHPEEADRAVVANWRNGAQRYSRIVEMIGERGNWHGFNVKPER